MGTIIIGALVSTILGAIGSKIALWRLRVYLAENKHKIKWQIIYWAFGPDPNMPSPVGPTPEPRQPWLPWRRRKHGQYSPWNDTPRRYGSPVSLAEKWLSLPVLFILSLLMSVAGVVVYMMVMLTRWS